MLDGGLVWRVWSGRAIQVFQDKWIPRPFNFKPWLNRDLNWDAHVLNLLTPSGGWDMGLLDNFSV